MLKFVVIFIVGLSAYPLWGSTLNLGSTDDLLNGLSHSNSGDTLYLRGGVYTGLFEINVPITLTGDSSAIIDGDRGGDVVTVTADSVVIRGITIQSSGTRLLKDHAGIKITGNFVEITDCRIRDNLHGIYVKGGSDIRIHNNTILGRFDIQESDRGNGIHLWSTANNVISCNDINYARDGIYFSFANNTQIRSNHIHHLRYGLHYMYSDSNVFEDNLFDYNVAGSALMYSEFIEFKRNIFAHCRGFRAYGILLQSVDYCSAYDNLILDNTKAIFFGNSSFNRFESNDIVQNDQSIQINVACEENVLVSNNFISNLSEVMMDESIVSVTNWSENGSGNFWSDYSGYDLDGDGIGDTPHQLQSVFEFLEQKSPPVRFYLYSPASQLLTVAEKRLPILRKTMVEDSFPIFRLIQNANIPWDNLEEHSINSSYSHLALWIAVLLLPLGFSWVARR
ncbi:MAG: nitrous oxide reductase family maturation protein NosD [candidate division Zixibacteria bacterium]|nr:nitrous oxide reductase family maturation protein NosD [candidate division Zixibacteria bacterium]